MDISQQLQQTPSWSTLNAYERAKLCCQLLNTLGLPIPSWMQIRQWIGKGSANDIHRAKQDFLLDRQTVKSLLVQQDEMPTALSGSLQDWWLQLKQAAEQEYLAEKQHWQHEKTEHAAQLTAAMQQIEQLQQQLTQSQAQLEQQQWQYQQACEQLALKQQTLTTQQQQIQQLAESLDAQQQRYLAEQTAQRDEQIAQQQQIEMRMEARLAAQLSAVADFQVFAAQQIDQARQYYQQQQHHAQQVWQTQIDQLLAQCARQQLQAKILPRSAANRLRTVKYRS